jgi:hypothetical protein
LKSFSFIVVESVLNHVFVVVDLIHLSWYLHSAFTWLLVLLMLISILFMVHGSGSWVLYLLGMLGMGSICLYFSRHVPSQPSYKSWNPGIVSSFQFFGQYIGISKHILFSCLLFPFLWRHVLFLTRCKINYLHCFPGCESKINIFFLYSILSIFYVGRFINLMNTTLPRLF